jgi:aldose 1-epimerase
LSAAVAIDVERAPILLRAGSAECEIWPDKGGSIARWTIDEQNMFRAALPDAASDTLPLGMASFPMVPYANRIGHGRFDWNGQSVELELNIPSEAHALHGTGWTAAWNIQSISADSIVLHHSQKADRNWPWHFDAEQHIQLTEYGLSIDMVATNLSDQMVPLGFGHHPYFDRKGAKLSFGAATVWLTGDEGLPTFAEAPTGMFDFAGGQSVHGRVLDNGYAGWDGNANIRWDHRPLQLDIVTDLRAAVVYVPDADDYFCFEPVPHIINALNLPGQRPPMATVAPGARFCANIQFSAKSA